MTDSATFARSRSVRPSAKKRTGAASDIERKPGPAAVVPSSRDAQTDDGTRDGYTLDLFDGLLPVPPGPARASMQIQSFKQEVSSAEVARSDPLTSSEIDSSCNGVGATDDMRDLSACDKRAAKAVVASVVTASAFPPAPASASTPVLEFATDQLRVLQAGTDDLRRAATADRLRANQWRFAFVILALAAAAALIMQTRMISRLEAESADLQLRNDRLAATLETQQANLTTLTERHDALRDRVEWLASRSSLLTKRKLRRGR